MYGPVMVTAVPARGHLGGQVERLPTAGRDGARVEVERVIELELGCSVQLAELGDVHAHILGIANHRAGCGVSVDVLGVTGGADGNAAARVVDEEVVPGVTGLVRVLDAVAVVVGECLDEAVGHDALDGGVDPAADVVGRGDLGRGDRPGVGLSVDSSARKPKTTEATMRMAMTSTDPGRFP